MRRSRARWTLVLAPLLLPVSLLLSGCGSLEEQVAEGLDELNRTQDAPFTILRHPLPPDMEWVRCPNGQSEGRMRTIGSSGDAIALSAGHLLVVERGAVSSDTDFVFVEPRSTNIVVNARAVGVGRFGGSGVRLRVSWQHRAGCTVPEDAVLMRIVPGGTARPLKSIQRGTDFIEVRVDSLSTFAIAT